ncbi:hypothetical protein V3C99_005398 [Haemonchus contortus]
MDPSDPITPHGFVPPPVDESISQIEEMDKTESPPSSRPKEPDLFCSPVKSQTPSDAPLPADLFLEQKS